MLEKRFVNKIRKIFQIKTLLFLLIFILGLIWTFLIPPFQKPDENGHYLRAVTVSKLQITCSNDGREIFEIPTKYMDFLKANRVKEMAFNYDEKTSIREILLIDRENNDIQESTILYNQYCNLPALSYILFVIPVYLGELFNSLLLGFFICRLFAFLIFYFSIFWSFHLIEKSRLRWIIIFYALTPMVLHQASSIGYDYLTLAIIPLLFSLNIFFISKKHFNQKYFILFLALILIFLNTKPGYYFTSLLYLLIPWRKINKNWIKYIFISISILFIIIFVTLVGLKIYGTAGVSYSSSGPNPILQLEYLKDFSHMLVLIKNTVMKYGDFYVKSFIGNFGWLDYSFIPFFYPLYILSAGILTVHISKDKIFQNSSWYPFLIMIFLVSSIGLIFISFYLLVDEVGLDFIYGVQGRYFLPFLPYLIFLLAFLYNKLLKSTKFQFILIFILIIYFLFEILYAILSRYYFA